MATGLWWRRGSGGGARLGIAAAATLALVLMMTGCGGGEDESSTAEATPAFVQPLSADFAVFRGPREAEDEMPKDLVPARIAAMLHIDLRLSRYARDLYGEGLYLVPSRKMTCMFGRNEAVGNCWPTETVAEHMAIASTLCGPGLGADKVVTFGVVPDGAKKVTVVRTNVPSRTVPVEGNVFVAKTSSEPPLPLQIFWFEDGKKVTHSAGIPAKVAREGC